MRWLASTATLRSLAIRNFRIYASGMLISQTGTWMTRLGQTLLVYSLTGSGTAIGVLAAFQYLPMLVLGPWAGTVTDRVDKYRLLFVVQACAGLQSLALGIAVVAGVATIPVVCSLAAVQGVISAFDNPMRRTFIGELVPESQLSNAIGLNSAALTLARVLGPAVAGIVVSTSGYAWCFFLDAFSYIAVLTGFALMRPREFHRQPRIRRDDQQIRDGIRYIRANPQLYVPLVMVMLIGMLGFSFTVSLPVLAQEGFGGSEGSYAVLLSVLSLGSFTGALIAARRPTPNMGHVRTSAIAFGVGMSLLAVAPRFWLALPAAVIVGLASVSFSTSAASVIQLSAEPAFRGRVMSTFALLFAGTTPFGSVLIGVAMDTVGPRSGVLLGALACFGAAGYATWATADRRRVATPPARDVLDWQRSAEHAGAVAGADPVGHH